MSNLTPAKSSFLVRQEWFIQFGLDNVLYGMCNYSLIHMRLMLYQEYMQPLLRLLSTSSVSLLVMSTLIAHLFQLGMIEKKPTSSKVLMGLIVLMFTLKTISIICNWYPAWLGFIYYSNAPDQALDVLETGGTSHSVHVIYAMDDLLTPLRLGIADSIMVSTHPLLLVDTTNSL
jgi:hypothetical protein